MNWRFVGRAMFSRSLVLETEMKRVGFHATCKWVQKRKGKATSMKMIDWMPRAVSEFLGDLDILNIAVIALEEMSMLKIPGPKKGKAEHEDC